MFDIKSQNLSILLIQETLFQCNAQNAFVIPCFNLTQYTLRFNGECSALSCLLNCPALFIIKDNALHILYVTWCNMWALMLLFLEQCGRSCTFRKIEDCFKNRNITAHKSCLATHLMWNAVYSMVNKAEKKTTSCWPFPFWHGCTIREAVLLVVSSLTNFPTSISPMYVHILYLIPITCHGLAACYPYKNL